jgi:hypothetical protein
MARTRQCDRCREWVSLDLDAELTEFEAAKMRRHLRSCAGCRAFASDVRAATALLRAARPEALPVPIVAGRARRRGLQGALVGAAATVAAVAALFGSGLSGDQNNGPIVLPTAAAGNVDLNTLRVLRRAELHMPAVSLENVRIRVVELD